MTWNWQLSGWPKFRFDAGDMADLETRFLRQIGESCGMVKHLEQEDKTSLIISLISNEALKTAEIEGEHLNHHSLQSSILRQFGLQTDQRRIPAAEQGLAEMMVDLYRSYHDPLTHDSLFGWHSALTRGRRDLSSIGDYRTQTDPMRVISGPIHDPKIHFEAPPSDRVRVEMDDFIAWFNDSAPGGRAPLPALTRTGITHLYFVSIHPFEDGNGRIGRALAEKSLAQCIGQPTLISLAQTIDRHRQNYYTALAESNHTLEITGWLATFAATILEATAFTVSRIEFLIAKARFHGRFRDGFNERQAKAIARLFEAGPEGFTGGLSARKFMNLTGAPHATATRDLANLVAKGALTKTGQLKGTRYSLNLS